ncbi:MAG: Purine nucleoside phosphorylase 1 [Candidatus Anoxychlamydiales bacterium]|nr:Purine nucleoside phosphorylase 1 [Candidatus Anoxychlamydiales bacterium]
MKIFISLICFLTFSFSAFTEDNFDAYFEKVETSASYLKQQVDAAPTLLIVLTAGVKGPLDEMTNIVEIDSKDIPFFPTARAQGHAGKLIFGKLDDQDIVLMQGRYHYYEGNSPQDVVFPYFVLNTLGVQSVITLNAVGGISEALNPGDIMLVTDHINCMSENSLRALSVQFPEKQFVDMTDAYSFEYQNLAKNISYQNDFNLKEGIYLATQGPNYETKQEVKMFRAFGADAVGMSTVFEVLACNFLKMKVLAFSCICNKAADLHEGTMSHEEVLEALNQMSPKLSKLTTICAKEILKNR